jgi:NADPH:quinone reductase-like Zn-dependent oxidoreductase
MKVAAHTTYGGPDVVSVREVDAPVPGSDQILVRVAAASVNAADLLAISGSPLFIRLGSGLLRPRHTVPGTDVAGFVEAVGEDVSGFVPGDRVAGDLSASGRGAFAEWALTRADALVKLPTSVSFEDAAAVPMAAVTARQALVGTAQVRPGETVLVDGASGGVGIFAVQIAKAHGARVTAICSEAKVDIARQAGADDVIPRGAPVRGGPFDVVYAVNGRLSLDEYDAVLAPRGRFVMTGGSGRLSGQVMLGGTRREKRTGQPHRFVQMQPNTSDLAAVVEMMQTGRVRPVIDRRFTLNEITSALEYLKAGKARGKVVITIDSSADAERDVTRSDS